MKKLSAKHLNLSIAFAIFIFFMTSYLVMDFWVFRPLPYDASPQIVQLHHRAKNFCSRILQVDSNFQVFLSRFLPDKPNPEVILLDVDYDVISAADAWPLPRSTYAEILSKLAEGDPKVVLIDIIFEKPQTPWVTEAIFDNITPDNAQALMPVINQLNHDSQLKEALGQSDYVLTTVLANDHEFLALPLREQYAATLTRHVLASPPVQVSGQGIKEIFPRSHIVGLRESILPLQIKAMGQGFSLFNFDRYGHPAELPFFHRLQAKEPDNRSFFLPNVVSEAIRVYVGIDHYELTLDDGVARDYKIGPHRVRTNSAAEMVVNFYNHSRIPKIRAHDLLQGKVDPQAVSGKIVVLSSDTEFLHDYIETSFGLIWGAEVMSYALSNILNGDYFYRPTWSAWFEIALLTLILIAVLNCCSRLKPSFAAIAVIILLACIVFLNSLLYIHAKQIFSVTIPVSFGFILYVQSTLIRVIREEQQKRFFKNALGLYLSPELSNLVADNPELLGLKGKEEELTVLFSDIRNFSSISETMTPEELTSFLQHYFSPMTDIIFSTGGTLDKFIGDAIMAFWGAPLPQEDHAQRACRSALIMLEAMDELLIEQRKELPDLPEIRMGVGIHSGNMRVGNMGSERRLNYTVIGDNVNLGSRLEGLTKHYGVKLIISEQTWMQLGEEFYGRRLDRVRVKGKEEATTIYELIGCGEPSDHLKEMISNWDSALAAYKEQEWDLACKLFTVWAEKHEDVTAASYLKAIEQFRSTETITGWPPVSVMTEK